MQAHLVRKPSTSPSQHRGTLCELRQPDLIHGTVKRRQLKTVLFTLMKDSGSGHMRAYVTYSLSVLVKMSVYLLTYLPIGS